MADFSQTAIIPTQHRYQFYTGQLHYVTSEENSRNGPVLVEVSTHSFLSSMYQVWTEGSIQSTKLRQKF